ncbi:DPP IV N-terminal domain-containing protein, partial [Longispora fulva]|uniref:DPP IV N-terminal domain-containing protein n=2 Tax=Bacteria TaxID=2 RepID=UPI0036259287
MNNTLLTLLFINLCGITMLAQNEVKEQITAEDYEHAVKFLRFNANPLVKRENVRPNWLNDGRFWYGISTPEGTEYVVVDPKTGKKVIAASEEELFKKAKISADKTPEVARNEKLSPDKKKVAFIRNWNLWIRNLETGEETQLTKDGIE